MGKSYTSKPRAASAFDLDGVEFATSGAVALLDLVEVAKMADSDGASPEGIAALGEFFESALGKDEYKRFRKHCREHGTDPDTLILIMQDLVEAVGENPTQRPSSLPAGPPATGLTSRVVSRSQGTVVEMPLTPEREAELRAAVTSAERAAG